MINIKWSNPYDVPGRLWLKGNLHTHTREGSGCGQIPLAESLARYAELKYDFLCVSDHMFLRDKIAAPKSLTILPGVEWNSPRGDHITVCSFRPDVLKRSLKIGDPAKLIAYLVKNQALVVLNHPNWQEPEHCSREKLVERSAAAGLEIYNAVIDRLAGTALATDKWDYLLSNGRRLLGFGSDDSHGLEDIGRAWIMVRAAARAPRAVMDAIKRGGFYASTGVTVRRIGRRGGHIVVDTVDADEIWAVGAWGVCLSRVHGPRMEFDCGAHKTPYVRFAAYGRGSAMAWTQPFFLDVPA